MFRPRVAVRSLVADLSSGGEPCSPVMEGIYDNYCVKKQMLNLTPVLAQQLLLVDEVIRAGRQMGGK
jgi:T-complex protein 1 subunit zeta